MNFSYYHFTLHTWTIFTLPALCFAYFIHKRNLPPRVSSIFQPILGEGIPGPVGKFINVVAIIGTRSEEHTSELQSRGHIVCRPLLENKKPTTCSNLTIPLFVS